MAKAVLPLVTWTAGITFSRELSGFQITAGTDGASATTPDFWITMYCSGPELPFWFQLITSLSELNPSLGWSCSRLSKLTLYTDHKPSGLLLTARLIWLLFVPPMRNSK